MHILTFLHKNDYKEFPSAYDTVRSFAKNSKHKNPCLCNGKLQYILEWSQLPIETLSDVQDCFSIRVVGECHVDVWTDLCLYGLTEEQICEHLPKLEKKLDNLWETAIS